MLERGLLRGATPPSRAEESDNGKAVGSGVGSTQSGFPARLVGAAADFIFPQLSP